MILRLSRKRNEAPSEGEALYPVRPCLNTSVRPFSVVVSDADSCAVRSGEVGGRGREVGLSTSRVFSLKTGVEPSQILLSPVWCSNGATVHEGQDLLCPSQYTSPLGAEVQEQMSRSGGQSEARLPVLKSPSKLGTHLSTHCSKDGRLSRSCPARE
ncbi:uncharacterized protein TNCV_1958411 [Trichonephila clavipes]|nr:uncharacterized protein TNCV_1958411 [Trichonephila clavipes]